MKLSRGKINEISQFIVYCLYKDEKIEFFEENNNVRLEVANILTKELLIDEEIDNRVREILRSYSKNVWEGTPDWDVLYEKHYREELKKRRGI